MLFLIVQLLVFVVSATDIDSVHRRNAAESWSRQPKEILPRTTVPPRSSLGTPPDSPRQSLDTMSSSMKDLLVEEKSQTVGQGPKKLDFQQKKSPRPWNLQQSSKKQEQQRQQQDSRKQNLQQDSKGFLSQTQNSQRNSKKPGPSAAVPSKVSLKKTVKPTVSSKTSPDDTAKSRQSNPLKTTPQTRRLGMSARLHSSSSDEFLRVSEMPTARIYGPPTSSEDERIEDRKARQRKDARNRLSLPQMNKPAPHYRLPSAEALVMAMSSPHYNSDTSSGLDTSSD